MDKNVNRVPLLLVGLFCLLPAIQTAVSVHWQWQTAISYPVFKVLMVCGPILVWLGLGYSGSEIKQAVGLKSSNMLLGLGVGVLMAGVIVGGYYLVLRRVIEPAGILAKVESLGLLKYYWVMAVFISLIHSLFEEYYWRGFILSGLSNWVSKRSALVLISGAIFGIHHIFAMLDMFELMWVVFCVSGTVLAGMIWSWMRLRGKSIWDCYVSHVFADLAVMWVGYDLILKANLLKA